MALTLQGDESLGETFTVLLLRGVEAVDYAATDLRAAVLKNGITIHPVLDKGVAQNRRFDADPLVTVICLRFGIDAVVRDELPIHLHMRARRAQISRRAFTRTASSEELHFDGDGEILVNPHALG